MKNCYKIEQKGFVADTICAVFRNAGDDRPALVDTPFGPLKTHAEAPYNLKALKQRIKVGRSNGENIDLFLKAQKDLQKAVNDFEQG